MCQSKAATGGVGKRCFVHHPGTQATINYIHAKTGIDKQQIYDIMKELRKEGRMTAAPTPEEIEKYFDFEEFKTKIDSSLTEKEKVTILKQLLAARSEAQKNPVPGGVWYAWKNALKRTVDKIKKPLIAVGLSSMLVLTACTGQSGITPTTPTDDNTSPTGVACSTEDPGPYGDVIAKEEVTDEYGTYCHTTIDPNSGALAWDESKVDVASLEANGFTVEDAKKAQQTAVTFLAEQGLDSTRLDNYSQSPEEWINANSSFLQDPQAWIGDIKDGRLSSTGLVVTDYMPTPIVRDGGPRAESTNIQVNRVYGFTNDAGDKAIAVEMGANATYDVPNSAIVDMYIKNHPETTVESLQQSNPDFFGDEPLGLILQGKFTYAFSAKDMFNKIAGASFNWSVNTKPGTPIV